MKGIVSFFFNSAMVIFALGFLSSRRYNVDRVAVKHVIASFRFPLFVVLLSQWIVLNSRQAYLVLTQGSASIYITTPWDVAAVVLLCVLFCLNLLFDCSPHLPATIHIIFSVSAR
jgi:hypothetical protein